MKALIVIDMQNDFVSGPLGTPEAQKIVPLVCEKIKAFQNEKIIFTRDTHQADYLSTQEGLHLPVIHCIENTPGWEIVPSLCTASCQIINKPTFGSTALVSVLEQDIPESITLVGLCTDICVISNALLLKAHFPNIPIYVDSKCCAGVTPQSHLNALEAMKLCHIEIL